NHELPPQPLAQGVLGHERLQLPDKVSVSTEREIGLDPLLEDRKPQLPETSDLSLRERLVRDVGEDWSTPERERAPKALGRLRRTPPRKRVSRLRKKTL